MDGLLLFVRVVGIASGWLFLLSTVTAAVLERRRRGTLAAHNALAPGRTTQQTLGLCPRCKAPKLPPGMVAPDYLRACQCPPLAAADVLAGRPPRPTN